MKARVAAAAAASILLAASFIGLHPALGAGVRRTKIATYAAVAMTDRDTSTNKNDCAAPFDKMGAVKGSEFIGQLNNGKGSYVENVLLPNGARVKELALLANDNDSEDVHLHLVRKQITDGLTPKTDGYLILASVASNGAVNGVIRRFSTRFIAQPKIDNKNFIYFLELVVCGNTEPYAGQIAYR